MKWLLRNFLEWSQQVLKAFVHTPSFLLLPELLFCFVNILSLLTFEFLSLLFHAERMLSPDLYPAGSASSLRYQLGLGHS